MIDIRYNAKNEKVKETFLEMSEEAKGRDSKTVKVYANAIREFELFTNFKDFKTFNIKQAIGFKDYLGDKRNKRTGKSISKSYLRYATYVKNFFEWLERQKGYSKYIKYNDVQYFSLTRNDRNKALATHYQESYEVSEILETIRKMPINTLIETKFDARQMRDKAMISLNLLTTPRISAFYIQSARIGSIKYFKNQDVWAFCQNPNTVNTKFARNITAYFIGNLQDIYQNVFDWIDYLKSQGFTDKDYLFPRFKASFTSDGFKTLILENKIIKSQTTIRKIFQNAFKNNDLHYLKPHTFRHAITRKANELPNSSKWISVLNQNFGHTIDSVIISSYGTIAENKRGKILKDFPLE
jgi:site-specific recombinase XerD